MPWKEASPGDQRTQSIADFLCDALSITELCALYGVSRKTGYQWIDRYLCQGPTGLEEIDDGIWNVYFGPLRLGRLHERRMRLEDEYGRLYRPRTVLLRISQTVQWVHTVRGQTAPPRCFLDSHRRTAAPSRGP